MRVRSQEDTTGADAVRAVGPVTTLGDALAACGSTRRAYAELLTRLHPVYALLARAVGASVGDAEHSARVTRLDALEADLAMLRGPGWRGTVVLAPACTAYADRLREVAFTWPAGLAVHLEARVLPDRQAAATLGRLVRPAYGSTGEALHFTRPTSGTELSTLLASLRAGVPDAPLDEASTAARCEAEARRAARLGEALLRELVADQRRTAVA